MPSRWCFRVCREELWGPHCQQAAGKAPDSFPPQTHPARGGHRSRPESGAALGLQGPHQTRVGPACCTDEETEARLGPAATQYQGQEQARAPRLTAGFEETDGGSSPTDGQDCVCPGRLVSDVS